MDILARVFLALAQFATLGIQDEAKLAELPARSPWALFWAAALARGAAIDLSVGVTMRTVHVTLCQGGVAVVVGFSAFADVASVHCLLEAILTEHGTHHLRTLGLSTHLSQALVHTFRMRAEIVRVAEASAISELPARTEVRVEEPPPLYGSADAGVRGILALQGKAGVYALGNY
jgi:hypothetical protein